MYHSASRQQGYGDIVGPLRCWKPIECDPTHGGSGCDRDYTAAKKACAALGASLPTIDDSSLNNFTAVLASSAQTWTSAVCRVVDGVPQFVWDDWRGGIAVEAGFTNYADGTKGHKQCTVGTCLALDRKAAGATWVVVQCSTLNGWTVVCSKPADVPPVFPTPPRPPPGPGPGPGPGPVFPTPVPGPGPPTPPVSWPTPMPGPGPRPGPGPGPGRKAKSTSAGSAVAVCLLVTGVAGFAYRYKYHHDSWPFTRSDGSASWATRQRFVSESAGATKLSLLDSPGGGGVGGAMGGAASL